MSSQPEPNTGNRKYSVAQWATGNVGARALRRTIEHPDLELVGVYVHSANKAGKDAGDLCGLPPVGIKATNSMDDILTLKPDCVLYMPHVLDYDEVCAILENGSNVVSTRMELHNPAALDPVIREKIEAACWKGGASLYASGASPGFITEAMPIALASIQRRLDCITIFEYAPSGERNSPEMIFEMMGFGADPNSGVNEHTLAHMRASFSPSLLLVAEAFGITVDSVEVSGGLGIARNDVHIAAGLVPKGTVAATRHSVMAMREGKPVIQIIANWYVSSDVDTTDGEEWDFRESGWRVLVEGDCPLDVSITFPVAPEDYSEMTPGLTANRPVNAIPFVCKAKPGIHTTFTLPQVIGKFE
jgi:4-hydroxy-tetrahydrodipicolinate reductase